MSGYDNYAGSALPVPSDKIMDASYEDVTPVGPGMQGVVFAITFILGVVVLMYMMPWLDDNLSAGTAELVKMVLFVGFAIVIALMAWQAFSQRPTGAETALAEIPDVYTGAAHVVIALSHEPMAVSSNNEHSITVQGITVEGATPVNPTPSRLPVFISVWSGAGPAARQIAGFKVWIPARLTGTWVALEKVLHHLEEYFNSHGLEPEYWLCSINRHLRTITTVRHLTMYEGKDLVSAVTQSLERRIKKYYKV